MGSFYQLRGGSVPNIFKTGCNKNSPENLAVKPEMEYTSIIFMKPAFILIQIGNAQITGLSDNFVELSEQRFYFPDMVKGHIAQHNIVLACQSIAPVRVCKHCFNIVKFQPGDLPVQDIEHSPGAVDAGHGMNQRLYSGGQ